MNYPIKSWSQWFDECAKHYKDVRMKMAYYEDGKPLSLSVMKQIRRDVLEKFPVTKTMRLLDVGGGVGLFSQAYQRRVKQIILTDISESMIRVARQMNPRETCLVCDAAHLPFEKKSFDRLLCYSVFHYFSGISHVRKVLDEFVRLMKPNGMIFIGDVLYPQEELRKKISSVAQYPLSKTLKWPTKLSHNLSKLKISTTFFCDYAKRKNLKCRILLQDIPGKKTSFSRYDVVLKLAKG